MNRQYTLMWMQVSRADKCFGPVPRRGDYVTIPHAGTHKVIKVTYTYKYSPAEVLGVEDIMVSID